MKKLLALISVLFPVLAFAHVKYVVTPEQFALHEGSDYQYLWSVFSDTSNLMIMAVTLVAVVGIVVVAQRSSQLRIGLRRMETRLEGYREFLPWITRLSLGIALIGAGTAGMLISPALPAVAPLPFVQILIGFFVLAGFMLVPSMIAVIVLYCIGLSHSGYLIGNIDVLALALAYLGLHSERPGIDDIFNFKPFTRLRLPGRFVPLVLRFGIGLAMIYLALVEKLLNPHLSELVVNQYQLTSIIPVSASMWVVGAGLVELAVGVLLLVGWYTRLTSVIAIVVLSLSFFFFKESVSSHVTLFGILSMVFILGGGYWSVDTAKKH